MHYLKVSKFRKLSLGLRSHVCYCGVRDERLSETPTGNKGGGAFLFPGDSVSLILDLLGFTYSGSVFISKGFN